MAFQVELCLLIQGPVTRVRSVCGNSLSCVLTYVCLYLVVFQKKKFLLEKNSNLRFGSMFFYTRSCPPTPSSSLDCGCRGLELGWGLEREWGAILLKWLHGEALKRGADPNCWITSELRPSDSEGQRCPNITPAYVRIKCLPQSNVIGSPRWKCNIFDIFKTSGWDVQLFKRCQKFVNSYLVKEDMSV